MHELWDELDVHLFKQGFEVVLFHEAIDNIIKHIVLIEHLRGWHLEEVSKVLIELRLVELGWVVLAHAQTLLIHPDEELGVLLRHDELVRQHVMRVLHPLIVIVVVEVLTDAALYETGADYLGNNIYMYMYMH